MQSFYRIKNQYWKNIAIFFFRNSNLTQFLRSLLMATHLRISRRRSMSDEWLDCLSASSLCRLYSISTLSVIETHQSDELFYFLILSWRNFTC